MLWEGVLWHYRHDIRLYKIRDISIDSIQVSCSSKGENIRFMRWLKSSLQVNNTVIILFNYLTHFKLDVWQERHVRRLVGKWLISTKVLMENCTHCQMKACVRWLVSMIILDMNNYY